MTAVVPTETSGYWYPESAPTAVDALNALRRYRTAELAMRKRTRSSMHMGDTDLAALRYLLEMQKRGRPVSPKDLAKRLEISSASVSVMLDRLAASGHVTRKPHPTDGRAVVVVATENSESEVRETLGEMHTRMLEAAESLDPAQTEAVVTFLTRLAAAIDEVGSESAHSHAHR